MAISAPICKPVHEFGDLQNTVSPKPASRNEQHKVLSFSFEKDLLPRREAALRSLGYNVFSTTSEACVRFEIQMGQCGVLLLCYTIPEAACRDLAGLFERHCHSGVIVAVMDPLKPEETQPAQIFLLDSDFPARLHLIQDFRVGHPASVTRNTFSAPPA